MAAAFETFKDIGIISSKECLGTPFENLRIWAPIAPLLDLGSPHAPHCVNTLMIRGVAAITPRFAFRRGYIAHARTDVPALATFTVSHNALRAVIP